MMATMSTMRTVNGRSGYRVTGAMLVTAVLIAVALVGCSSNEPKPMAQPSVQDVKGNADRSFDRLKQEERQQGARPSPSGY